MVRANTGIATFEPVCHAVLERFLELVRPSAGSALQATLPRTPCNVLRVQSTPMRMCQRMLAVNVPLEQLPLVERRFVASVQSDIMLTTLQGDVNSVL